MALPVFLSHFMNIWFTLAPVIFINIYIISGLVIFSFIYKKRPKTDDIENRHSSVILNKWIREFWWWITSPVLTFFLAFKIRPNTISLWGTVFAGLSAVAFVFGEIGIGGWLMIFGASLDFFDGRVARLTNQVTKSGAFFDSSLDRISEGLTLTGMAYLYRDSPIFWIVMAAYLGSSMTSYTKARGEVGGVDYAGGMMQRPERLAYMGASAVILPMLVYAVHRMRPDLVSDYRQTTELLYAIPLGFIAVFSNIATYNRITNIMRLLREKHGESS